jgi:hypothetical protein
MPILLTLLAALAVAEPLPQSAALAASVAVAPKQTDAGPCRQNLAGAIRRCWLVDPASDATRVALTLGFAMTAEGRPVADSFSRIGTATGPDAGIEAAWQSARRAVLRCGVLGFDLPPDRRDDRKQVEITFDPTMMVLKMTRPVRPVPRPERNSAPARPFTPAPDRRPRGPR